MIDRAAPQFPVPAALTALGLDGAILATAPPLDAGSELGRVVRADRGLVTVACADGLRRCALSGRLRHHLEPDPSAAPTVGDWVVVRGPTVLDLLPRRTVLRRGDADETSTAQAVAANVDVVWVVVPLGGAPNLRRAERTLALVWASGALPVVVLTKADLSPDLAGDLEAVASIALGVEVLPVSTVTGDGLEAVSRSVQLGRTAVLLGASGAGKSSLVNALVGAEVLTTGAIREDGRGRHTTTARELIALPGGGLLIDTPGLRAVALFDDDGVEAAFGDVESLAESCRFTDCGHRTEPGCAVLAAVDAGVLDRDRLASWRKLRREEAWQARRRDARATAEEKARWKAIHVEQRRRGHR